MISPNGEIEQTWGPAMSALSEQRRAFVQHYVATGGSNATLSAQASGFSPTNPKAAAVTANRLLKDERIQAAISETCRGFFVGDLPKFAAALREIALTPGHPQQVKVLIWVHQMLGFSPITRHEVKQQIETIVTFDRQKAIEELQVWERELGTPLLPRPEPEPEEDEPEEPHILARPERDFRKRPQRAA